MSEKANPRELHVIVEVDGRPVRATLLPILPLRPSDDPHEPVRVVVSLSTHPTHEVKVNSIAIDLTSVSGPGKIAPIVGFDLTRDLSAGESVPHSITTTVYDCHGRVTSVHESGKRLGAKTTYFYSPTPPDTEEPTQDNPPPETDLPPDDPHIVG